LLASSTSQAEECGQLVGTHYCRHSVPALVTQPPAPALAPADPISRGSRVETKIPESLPPTRSSESSPGVPKSQTPPVRRLQIITPSTARGQRKAFAKAR
jgi:hypothetical protein